jgi:anthranilate synthase component 1
MHYTQPASIDLFRLHELYPDRYPYLLESVAHGTAQSRYDILFAIPQAALRLTAAGTLYSPPGLSAKGFLAAFEQWFQRDKNPHTSDMELPYHGGWFVYLAYELVSEIEPGIELPRADDDQTVAYAVRCPAAIIRDHQQGLMYLFAEDEHAGLLTDLQQDVASVEQITPQHTDTNAGLDEIIEEPPEQYCQAVRRIREYIIEGDVFQVNLSRLWKARSGQQISASDLYRKLRINNPAPFAGIARLPDYTVISSSPERLVSVRDKVIETRPIAGTRPRSGNDTEDQRLAAELMAHPKEQAEHIMLIDLERNDLGRVCKPGSIRVNELMGLESYTHVHHIVSNVQGEIRDGVGPSDIIRAVFPGGTITGCPKVRCMQIIAELEGQPRGAYTGSMGYINVDGSMDLNILIRTLLKYDNEICLRAGAGIVYDSDPQHELDETRAKARGLLRALSREKP